MPEISPSPALSLTSQKSHAKFAASLIAWQQKQGRHDLPWQGREPYAVWVSEIMLQQTQVMTVIAYYKRFMQRFPSVQSLAEASQPEVLALWSGLGYYSRARNLHQAAQIICQDYAGRFPSSAAELIKLPGIGASTAAAIAAFCYDERVAIMDANVKRVLSRVFAFDQDLSVRAHATHLQNLAQSLLPKQPSQMTSYTQGIMDLGASLCKTKSPSCESCPVQKFCRAFAQQNPEAYPIKTRKLLRKSQDLYMLWIQDACGKTLLVVRPQKGIWAGLHCLPVFDSLSELKAHVKTLSQALGLTKLPSATKLPSISHQLTHRDLRLHTYTYLLDRLPFKISQIHAQSYDKKQIKQLGMPAPVSALLINTIQLQ